MSELPISSKYRSRPDDPVSDAEREQLSSRLNAAFTDGALESDDYRQRLDRLFAARRLGELVEVVEGLPPAQTYAQPGIVAQSPAGRPGELTPAHSGTKVALVVAGSVAAALVVLIVLIALLL